MINEIRERADLRIYGKIGREFWGILWFFCRGIDQDGTGRVEILVPEVLTLLEISEPSFYRWLKEGKEAGAFWHYKRIDKHTELIYLGSKARVCKKLGITDWDSSTEIKLGELLNNPDIEIEGKSLRKLVTKLQTHWMQKRSIEAAKEEERKKVPNKKSRRKPKLPYKKIRGAAGKPSSQFDAGQKCIFSRHYLPTGASQKGIGKSLGVCDRTIRRHLEGIERIQIMYKVKPSEVKRARNVYTGEMELFYIHPTGKKTPVFKRHGEYYRYGCNLYNLDLIIHSEFTQRLKYKFSLLQDEIPLEAIQWSKNKNLAYSPLGSTLYLSKHEILEKLSEKYELDSLDQIIIHIYWELKTRSFGKFMIAVKEELKRRKREEYRRAREGQRAA